MILIVNQSLNFEFFVMAFLLFIFQILLIYGFSLIVSCLNVFFRDIAQILGVLFMLAFWITPIVYPKDRTPELYRWFLNLNPLTHMVESYRFVFLGDPTPSLPGMLYWIFFCVGTYYLGHFVLRRTRNDLVDLV